MMTTAREIANNIVTAYQWIYDHADHLPGNFDFTTTHGPTLTWRDPEAANFHRARLEHLFGPATEHSHAYTEAGWSAEGTRPALRVLGITLRGNVA